MPKFLSKVTFSISTASFALVALLIGHAPASAFDFTNDSKAIGVTADDIGKEFQVNFDGNVSTQNITGLTSEAKFKLLSFSNAGSTTVASFSVSLKNTSSGGVTSRTSALGFNVENWASGDLGLSGVGNGGATSVSGLFTKDRSGSFPNQFGDVEVCFTNGNTCQGGSNGGVSTGDPESSFTATLAFDKKVDFFALSNFGVRYQSINNVAQGTSGTGRGLVVDPRPRQGVPEPTAVGAILLVGLVMGASKKRQASAAV